MSKELFVDKNPTLETSWRSIILLGRNVASYKFALAKSLLEIDTTSSEIEIQRLAVPFARNICEHLKENEKQRKHDGTQTFASQKTCVLYNCGLGYAH